jgi:hypothetical protein
MSAAFDKLLLYRQLWLKPVHKIRCDSPVNFRDNNMHPELAAFIREDTKNRTDNFFDIHEVFVLAFNDNPIKLLGLAHISEQNQKFIDINKEIRAISPELIWHIDYFKTPIPEKHSYACPPSSENFFWYLILSLRKISEEARSKIRGEAHIILQRFCIDGEIPARVLSLQNAPEDIKFHYLAQEMYSKLIEPPPGRRPALPSYDSINEIPDEQHFDFPQGKMSVNAFKNLIRQNAQFLVNNLIPFSRFLRQEDREYKFTREEDLPLYALLRHLQIESEAEIELAREGSPIDFKITRSNGTILLVEVTQALPKDGHLYRQAIVARPMGLPLHERTRHQKGKDTFPSPIINAILAKHKIGYKNSPILLVFVVGDYTDEDDDIIRLWVELVNKNSQRGLFSRIFLVELARQKVIELFK